MRYLYLRTQYAFGLKAGGSVGHTKGVINALSKKVDLTLWSNDPIQDVNVEQRFIKPVRLSFLPFAINELLYNFVVLFFLRKQSFDVVYHRYSAYSFSAALWCKMKRKKLILEFNSSELWKMKNWSKSSSAIAKAKYFIIGKIESFNLINSYKIVVVSNELKRILVSQNISERKIEVIPNGIDPDNYYPMPKDAVISKELALDNKKVIGFIGTFGPWHGVDVLIKSYHKLLLEHVKFKETTKLLLIGDGELMASAQSLVKEYGIEDHVVFTGIIDQTLGPKYLSLCDILVNPTVENPDGSTFFGSPTKLFEYMAVGKPIISSNLAQMSEILCDKETALLIPPGSIEDLSVAMFNLLDSEYYSELGSKAYEMVRTNHTWDINIERLLNSCVD